MNLTTLDRVKTLAEQTTTANDTWFNQVIAARSAAIEREIDRFVEKVERTEKFRPNGRDTCFFLRGVPVDVGETITVVNGGTAVDVDDYRVGPDLDLIEFVAAPVDDWDGHLEITYTGGLAADVATLAAGEYADLSLACELEVLSLWQRRKQLAEQVSESIQGSSYSIVKSLPLLPEVRDMLQKFRLGA